MIVLDPHACWMSVPPPVPDEAHPIYNNPPQNLGGNVDPLNQDNQGNDPNANVNPINHDNQAEMDNNENEDLPPNDQDDEYSANSVTEQTSNKHEDPELSTEGDNGTPLMPTDPTLPPRAQQEIKRLATDGVGPTIYQGRTRSQTRQPEHNMSTMGHLGSSTPLLYQHMTNFEKELFHRRIAGVRVPSEVGYEQNEVLRHTVLTQYTLKKGLQVFGPPEVEAVYKKLQQLHERKVGEPRDASTLSPAQKKNALGYLMFLKQKRTGQIKGRGCADGCKQRLHTPKDDASSPTVATESVLSMQKNVAMWQPLTFQVPSCRVTRMKPCTCIWKGHLLNS